MWRFDKMMSVNEFFYGNQATPTQIIKTSTPVSAVKQQHPPYGSQYTIFSHDATMLRDDHDAGHGRNYSNHSNFDSYPPSRYQQETQVLLNSKYPSSAYVSSSAYDNSPASMGMGHRRVNLSDDFSSPGYSRHGSRGSMSKPVSTWVELRVPICCEGCVERVTSHLIELRGVEGVTCDQIKQKVVVKGTAAAADVLRVCQKLFKRSEFWRYQYDWM